MPLAMTAAGLKQHAVCVVICRTCCANGNAATAYSTELEKQCPFLPLGNLLLNSYRL